MNAPTRAEFLARRQSGIGGSDISVILGANPWRTPYELWLDKTGRAEPESPDPDRDERLHFGNVLEDVVAREDAARGGYKIQRVNAQITSPLWHRAIANIDRAVVTPGSVARWNESTGRLLGADAILECKTANAFAASSPEWGESGTDEVPEHYWLQVQWYLGATGVDTGRLAVLFGGQKLRRYVIARDAELYADLVASASDWWRRHIDADTPPAPQTENEARIAYRRATAGKTIEAEPAIADAVRELEEIKGAIKALEGDEQEIRGRILCAIGDAETLTYQGKRIASWKANKPSQKTDWKSAYADLGPTAEHTARFTTTTEGARVLRLA